MDHVVIQKNTGFSEVILSLLLVSENQTGGTANPDYFILPAKEL
jgi:hypothetical protein